MTAPGDAPCPFSPDDPVWLAPATDPAQASLYAKHLLTCEVCRSREGARQELEALAAADRVSPPPELERRILTRAFAELTRPLPVPATSAVSPASPSGTPAPAVTSVTVATPPRVRGPQPSRILIGLTVGLVTLASLLVWQRNVPPGPTMAQGTGPAPRFSGPGLAPVAELPATPPMEPWMDFEGLMIESELGRLSRRLEHEHDVIDLLSESASHAFVAPRAPLRPGLELGPLKRPDPWKSRVGALRDRMTSIERDL